MNNEKEADKYSKGSKKSFFKSTFLAGIFATLPLVVTIYVLKMLYGIIARNFGPGLRKLMQVNDIMLPEIFIGILSVVVFILTILFIGILIRLYIGRVFFSLIDKAVTSIPLARTVYNVIKQMTESFSSSSDTFEKVVLVDFPREGIYAVGFVIRRTQKVLEDTAGRGESYNVFVPTAPNPTSGFIMLVPKEKCVEVPVSVDEGLKYILSVGIINMNSKEQILEKIKNNGI